MDYSKTVNLPTTDFPMKANLPQREPSILAGWIKEDLYRKIQAERDGAELFILHDGPPYANGHIHIGHSLNKILKDVIVKHKSMQGFRAPYVPGWDCHGLPIEHNVTKDLGSRAESMPKVDIRRKCRDYAAKFVSIQMEEFKRLGVFGDFENPYKTMTLNYESKIVEVFGGILKEGYIYRSKKPIYWCPTCVTALAEAEVEYDNHSSPSIYVKFKVEPATLKKTGIDRDNTYVVIWTTTPWTLPANLALSFHPDFPYSAYKFGADYYVIARGLLPQMESVIGASHEGEVPLSREDIAGLTVQHPFIARESRVIFGTHVTLEQGTGIVHTAPGHGHEDYVVGREYGLEVYCPVDERGRYTDEFPEMVGVNVFAANPRVVDLLKSKNALIHTETIDHSYPHCWRCKRPLIYRATEQWFMSIDHRDMRKKGIASVSDTRWIPGWGESRFLSMVESRPDWCLSRQRSWGVPIPSFTCTTCGKNLMTPESVQFFSQIALIRGIDTWYTDDIAELVPPGTRCSCGGVTFAKEFDILDVWFDSGVSHFVVLETWPGHRWPADLYLEGSDQHRGWFQSSLWPALALRERPPYKTVLTHGFVLDEAGKAMSKSQGNVIHPEVIIKEYGADILRLWVSSEDYRNDVRIGMDMMKQIADSYRKIRNTFKFIIGNLSDFTEKNAIAYDQLTDVDQWILHKLYHLSARVIEHYEQFEFHQVYRRILNFCAVELSSVYFDVSKDILYIELRDSLLRRSNQTALSEIFKVLVRLVAPILAFTGEEIWQFMGLPGSIHQQRYYLPDARFDNPSVDEKVSHLVSIKEDILKAIENARREKLLKTSLEAEIHIVVNSATVRSLLESMGAELKRFFQIAAIIFHDKAQEGMQPFENSSIEVRKTTGIKCTRCWNFFENLGSDPEHPELCDRCTAIITTTK